MKKSILVFVGKNQLPIEWQLQLKETNISYYHIHQAHYLVDFIRKNSHFKVQGIIFEFGEQEGMARRFAISDLRQQFPSIPFIALLKKMEFSSLPLRKIGFDDFVTQSITVQELLLLMQDIDKGRSKQKKQEPTTSNEYKISWTKRLFDVVFSLTALIFLSPVFALVALAIRIESKGPIFYAAKRSGTGFKVFPFYKFRSMRVNADQQLSQVNNFYASPINSSLVKGDNADGSMLFSDQGFVSESTTLMQKNQKSENPFFKVKNDPRVTKVGAFLRNTSIDELPQLLNVLLGHMSIVGNRPLPLYEAEQLTSDEWVQRFMAPAGITGLWQVTERGTAKIKNSKRKSLDNHYAQQHNLLLDFKILWKTIPAAIQRENV